MLKSPLADVPVGGTCIMAGAQLLFEEGQLSDTFETNLILPFEFV